MSEQEFWKTLLGRMLEHEDSSAQFAELMLRYVETLADAVFEGISTAATDLWTLGLLLGLRDRPPEGVEFHDIRLTNRIVVVDFSRILNAVTARPDDLYSLSPRRFEELVAHIFEQFGYQVELTPRTRDGGFDISAIRRSETEVRLLIECKRYIPPNKVGRPVVQQIYGVLMDRRVQATKAIVATTSTFTPDARAFLMHNRWNIEGRDRAGILEWMELIRNAQSGLWLPAEKDTHDP